MAFATHAGGTEDEFDRAARAWLASARHPKLGRLFTQCVYQPQLELLDYLRANGFKTFIVSGGGIDLMRAFAEDVYGIPPEQVIGSSVKTRFEVRDGRGVLVKLAELGSFDDREVKPENIQLHIGRRPILAFGNSDGDLAMLRYVKSGEGPSLALLLHHDDAEREFAYDRDFALSPLAEALDRAAEYGVTVASMMRDWNAVFPAPGALSEATVTLYLPSANSNLADRQIIPTHLRTRVRGCMATGDGDRSSRSNCSSDVLVRSTASATSGAFFVGLLAALLPEPGRDGSG